MRFAYRLALRLGYLSVREMLSRLSWLEFQEWRVFDEVEPFGPEREDIRVASITQMLANVNRDTKKRRRPYPIGDFVLRFGDAPKLREPQTWQQQKTLGKQYYLMFSGGKGKKPGPGVKRQPRGA